MATKRPRTFTPDEAKFKNLLLYVCLKSQTDPGFGAIKLNKLLWESDRLAYGLLERPITGVEYARRRLGPAPKRLMQIRDQMISDGLLGMEERLYDSYPNPQKRPVALSRPDLSVFSADEIALVDSVIERFRSFNGTDIADWSHGLYPCRVTVEGETIPYETVFLSDRRLTACETQHMCELAQERGWDVF
jgi:hypothetical protein